MYRTYQDSICKDNLNKKITGVCAGIARHFDIPRWQVRSLAVLALIVAPPMAITAYVVATFLMRAR